MKEHLRAAFGRFGIITDVKVVRDQAGKPRGFGFVEYARVLDAAKALSAMNGKKISGRTVAVDWCLARSKFEALKEGANGTEGESDGSGSGSESEESESESGGSESEGFETESSGSEDGGPIDVTDAYNSDGELKETARKEKAAAKKSNDVAEKKTM